MDIPQPTDSLSDIANDFAGENQGGWAGSEVEHITFYDGGLVLECFAVSHPQGILSAEGSDGRMSGNRMMQLSLSTLFEYNLPSKALAHDSSAPPRCGYESSSVEHANADILIREGNGGHSVMEGPAHRAESEDTGDTNTDEINAEGPGLYMLVSSPSTNLVLDLLPFRKGEPGAPQSVVRN